MKAENVVNKGGNVADKKYDLNPDHTHFILMDDAETPDFEGLQGFRLGLETRFQKPVGKPRRYFSNYMNATQQAAAAAACASKNVFFLLILSSFGHI